MKNVLNTNDDLGVAVVNSRRMQEGVEILEREVHLVTTSDVPLEQTTRPTLVITDALASATQLFVSKTRAEIDGLSSFFNLLKPISLK